MPWHDEVWPKQRANVTRKRISPEERAYRARVRANKTKAAVAVSNRRISEHRATTKAEQRLKNKSIIAANERTIDEKLDEVFKSLKVKRRKERNRRWAKLLEKAHAISRDASSQALRRWQKAMATPLWANKGAMLAIYREARRLERETGKPHHVDHIVPLVSRRVCGLHCEHNLCVLPGSENTSKGNRRWPDMP